MTPDDILKYCLAHLDGVVEVSSWGERGLFYNPDGLLKRGIYILTIKEKDGENDGSSNLSREDIWCLNIGLRKTTFQHLFGEIPKRPTKGKTVDIQYDFTAVNTLIPHPVYAWMAWVRILNPSEESFEQILPLIQEAYDYAKDKYRKRRQIH